MALHSLFFDSSSCRGWRKNPNTKPALKWREKEEKNMNDSGRLKQITVCVDGKRHHVWAMKGVMAATSRYGAKRDASGRVYYADYVTGNWITDKSGNKITTKMSRSGFAWKERKLRVGCRGYLS